MEIHLANSGDTAVTFGKSTSAERMRRLRQRDLVYQREDWQLFLDPSTLSQKAGCNAEDINKIVLKELVDNALDAGANVDLTHEDGTWVVTDDGPGLTIEDVRRFFCVNRPLLSSKLKRLPLRGMLGNGLRVVMGAVAAFDGTISVETQGHRLTLSTDKFTGTTVVEKDEPAVTKPGMTVRLTIGRIVMTDATLAKDSILLASHGHPYAGSSSPWWYGARDLERLFTHVTPETSTVADVCRDLGFKHVDGRQARSLDRLAITEVLMALRIRSKQVTPKELGVLGPGVVENFPGYVMKEGRTTTQASAQIPYVVEAWAMCERSVTKGYGNVKITLVINRSRTLAQLHGSARSPRYLSIKGCGVNRYVEGPSPANYDIWLSVISPYVQLATDGKEPDLKPYGEAIAFVLRKACGQAHRAMERPVSGCSIVEAAEQVLPTAYLLASGNGTLPANARQVMYAARPTILELTRKDRLEGQYFIQKVMRNYILDHPAETENWDIVFDARGHYREPHTGTTVGLGTIQVRDYLRESLEISSPVQLKDNTLYPTTGPENRFSSVLFLEKEGFDELLQEARIEERFDIAIMSTKGLSVGAARRLIDGLAGRGAKIFVLHDFDLTGFKIFGTLGTDSKVYTFLNKVELIDLGLRLSDVRRLRLQEEPTDVEDENGSHAATLKRHGAAEREIDFLLGRGDDEPKRVELNAMTAPRFIAFIERKLTEHGLKKLIPDPKVLAAHAQRVVEQALAQKIIDEAMPEIERQSGLMEFPTDWRIRLKRTLEKSPELSWDMALAQIIRQKLNAT